MIPVPLRESRLVKAMSELELTFVHYDTGAAGIVLPVLEGCFLNLHISPSDSKLQWTCCILLNL